MTWWEIVLALVFAAVLASWASDVWHMFIGRQVARLMPRETPRWLIRRLHSGDFASIPVRLEGYEEGHLHGYEAGRDASHAGRDWTADDALRVAKLRAFCELTRHPYRLLWRAWTNSSRSSNDRREG